MRLKSFTAANLTAAMELVREQLGPDAVILSTQEFDDHGVKVTAALDDDPGDLLSEDLAVGARDMEEIGRILEFHRVPLPLADRLLRAGAGHAREGASLMLASAFDALFQFAELPAAEPRGRQAVLLMGPSGGGKTATAAKLCAHARVGGRKASFISTDTVSAGAREQAESFATALGVSFAQAGDGDSLSRLVADQAEDALVVIDTTGTNPFDDAERANLALLLRAAGARGLLVLPAGGDALESAETAIAFADCGADAIIATRVDAARRLGGLLSAAQASGLALMAAGIAPSIGSGLHPINPVALARLVMPETEVEERLPATGTHP